MDYSERSALLSFDKHLDYSIETSLDCSANWKRYATQDKTSKSTGASWLTGTFLLVNAALGAGLLNYPVAYDRLGGIGFSTFVQVRQHIENSLESGILRFQTVYVVLAAL